MPIPILLVTDIHWRYPVSLIQVTVMTMYCVKGFRLSSCTDSVSDVRYPHHMYPFHSSYYTVQLHTTASVFCWVVFLSHVSIIAM